MTGLPTAKIAAPLHELSGRLRLPDGAVLHYQIIGKEGPYVAVIQGGRHALAELKRFSAMIASKGYRVILHDRRNCGQSTLDFDNELQEEDFWADDLCALLTHLHAKPAHVIGRSRGTRIAMRLIQRNPGMATSLMLWGLSAGSLAVRFLNDYYYGQYVRACEAGGMAAVGTLEHFSGLIEARPENKEVLLALDPAKFISTMNRWRDAFLVGKDLPVMGISEDDLRGIDIPTSIVPYYEKMHPFSACVYAHRLIPNSHLFDFAPERHEHGDGMTDADPSAADETVAGIWADWVTAST